MNFLGFDCSTQSFKVVAIDSQGLVIKSWNVNFQEELGSIYNIQDGMTLYPDNPGRVTSPALMWFHGLELVLNKMKNDMFDFSSVAAVSGSGQQHGSVYWSNSAGAILNNLDPTCPLVDQLQAAIEIPDSPMWADSSTTGQCKRLEYMLGGAQNVARISGSRAYERFTGNQIARLLERLPKEMSNCARISLVSSAMASVLLGKFAEIDYSDGSGMNLLSIQKKEWDDTLVNCVTTANYDLSRRLGKPVASNVVQGEIANYFVERYGFDSNCKVVTWSGDNPNSFASMGLSTTDIAVSLGTSDTVFGVATNPKPSLQGHIFVNPVDVGSYMVMLCYKNGSLVRESFLRSENGIDSWDEFNNMLESSAPGNEGVIGVFFDQPEITPQTNLMGRFYFNKTGDPISSESLSVSQRIRAVVESRFLSMRSHCRSIGVQFPIQKVIVTGGASKNQAILQVAADVFSAPVHVDTGTSESAALGAAMRAQHSFLHPSERFRESVKFPERKVQASPRKQFSKLYESMAVRYVALEQEVQKGT